jgi:hypothetical protein
VNFTKESILFQTENISPALRAFGWRQSIGGYFGRKTGGAMSTVAERFFRAMPAPAERYGRPPAEVENISVLIYDFERTFNADAAVVFNNQFCCHDDSP